MFTKRRLAWTTSIALTTGLVLTACGAGDDNADTTTSADYETIDEASAEALEALAEVNSLSGNINGAGASFPFTVYEDWRVHYEQNVQSDVRINYQSVGSGAGITQFLEDTIDFGTSEAYLREGELSTAEGNRDCEAIQVPMLFGSVAIAFQDESLDGLVLDADTIAKIFTRDITNYSDDEIAALNPGRDLPDLEIIPVHRSDGSGTTSVFTTWLEDESGHWVDNMDPASGTEVNWASGTVGGQGNEGVAANLQAETGGLGYVNQSYAYIEGLPQAEVINADGNAVYPTLEATTAGIENLEIPDNYQFDILGIGGDGYPITGTVWNFFYTCGYDDETAAVLKDYWIWATQTPEADQLAMELGYAPMGPELKARVLDELLRINENN
ncbi:phosphate ABC transporter substrate-binding protein PstS [Natronoglycomyces albus]|uniref:Phosphate-binding protein n=1 Tax=Natronoglycomyces albus TaxID=2811108 RepID=A0A895XL66_9ACTN|nr:phosphate ABC transporter substrate-binding protein PstS [Natronoglycomyces albus]QSB06074.1 phosphate ABC transporter substrate-binding protein PstS [Natronoglycomyces albus]